MRGVFLPLRDLNTTANRRCAGCRVPVPTRGVFLPLWDLDTTVNTSTANR